MVSTKILFNHCYGKYAIAAPGFFITEQTRPLLINEDGSLSARGKAEWNRNLALIAKTLRKINVKTLRKKLSTFNSFA